MQVPPPIDTNGSDIVQPPVNGDVVVDDGGPDDVVPDPADVPFGAVVVDVDEVVLPVMPGGSHPPLTHAPPPIDANGSGVVQPAETVVVEVVVDGGVVGEGDAPVMPGGSHPPLTHEPPPIVANGSVVVQPPADEDEDEDDDVLDDVDPESVNESTAVLVPTSKRPVAIQVSYVEEEPAVLAHTSSQWVPRSPDAGVHVKNAAGE